MYEFPVLEPPYDSILEQNLIGEHKKEGCQIIQGMWKGTAKWRNAYDIWEQNCQKLQAPVHFARFMRGKRGITGSALTRSLGCDFYVLDDESEEQAIINGIQPTKIKLPDLDPKHNPTFFQWVNKLKIIELALDSYEHVLWTDFDIIQLKPIPRDFWDRFVNGPPLRSKLTWRHNSRCKWRAEGQLSMSGGGIVYCRDKKIIQNCINNMLSDPKLFPTDEEAISFEIDGLAGGWPDNESYKELGFDIPEYIIWNSIHPQRSRKPDKTKIIFAGR